MADRETGLGGAALTEAERRIIADFHALYYSRWVGGGPEAGISFLGTPLYKCPLDLWMYQELVWRRRPDLIVETGTFRGGSGHFLATICDMIGHGRVLTIDIAPPPAGRRPVHPRLDYLEGSSVSAGIVAEVTARAEGCREVMVILDSDHRTPHVFRELTAYAPLIRPGGYLIVEDTNVNGNPVLPGHGPGPREAVALFLAHNPDFAADPACERLLMSLNPGGYLVRRPAPI